MASLDDEGTIDDTGSPLLTIVVVSYECRDLVLACLDSLKDECTTNNYSVVLVDNASLDSTVEDVRRGHPWVSIRSLSTNVGFAVANNGVLFDEPTSDYTLLLNPDTVVPNGAISRCLSALIGRPEVGMLGCKLVTPDGRLDHACKRGFPTPSSTVAYFLGLHHFFPRASAFNRYTTGHLDEDREHEVDAINGAMMLVRREAVEAVGPMDENYWLYMEDLDWCYRFWAAQWPVFYWPGAEIVHVKGGSSGKARSWKTNYHFHRGMWLFYRKHYASGRSLGMTAIVWAGIWSKLALSASRSVVIRSLSR